MDNIVALKPQSTDVLMQIKSLIEAKVIVSAKLAQEISVSPTALSQVLNNKYAADPTNIIEKLQKWIKLREERQQTPNIDPGFVMTQTAEHISNDLTYAQVTESIVVIFGASGVGKSETLRHYQAQNNNVWMVTASPSRSSLLECLYELALELGMDDAPRRKGNLSRLIRQRLKGTEGLIIIDEADHLDYPTLEELRILQEEVGVGMALVGNNKVYAQLTGGRRNEDFARLFSRIAKKRGINKTKQADVRALAEAWNVLGEQENILMQQIAEKPGGLRLLTKILKLAVMYSKGKTLTEKVIRIAFKELEGVTE